VKALYSYLLITTYWMFNDFALYHTQQKGEWDALLVPPSLNPGVLMQHGKILGVFCQ